MLTARQCFSRQFKRDWLLMLRQPRLIINSALFFLMITVFFPLTIPPDPILLEQVIPGVIWIAVLLALLLASDRLFLQDYEEGVLEQWLVSGYPMSLLVSAKLTVNWLATLLPLLLFCPLLALFFNFSIEQLIVLMLTFIVATPALLMLCAVTSAFSFTMQQKGIFMSLILLPLTLPIIIFASGTLNLTEFTAITASLAILSALSLLAICFLPFAIAAIIRISLSA